MKKILAALIALSPSTAFAQAVSSNYMTSAIVPGQCDNGGCVEHASGDAIGGWKTVAFFRNGVDSTGLLSNIMVTSLSGSTQAVSFFIYTKDVTATSTCTDNVAFSEASADAAFRAVAPFTVTLSSVVGSTITGGMYPLAASVASQESSANLYICMVAASPSVTPLSASDFSYKLSGIRD